MLTGDSVVFVLLFACFSLTPHVWLWLWSKIKPSLADKWCDPVHLQHRIKKLLLHKYLTQVPNPEWTLSSKPEQTKMFNIPVFKMQFFSLFIIKKRGWKYKTFATEVKYSSISTLFTQDVWLFTLCISKGTSCFASDSIKHLIKHQISNKYKL